jgi:membrane-bound metal-dependent hydrolase YbcI (DUF457 family)
MLPLAHLGIGQCIANAGNRLPLRPILIGTILPDLIDKPLYYIPVMLTGKRGTELGLFSGTRTVGHSLLFLAAILLVSAIPGPRRRWWLALGAGVASHLLLDNFLESFAPLTEFSSRIALFFPYYGVAFPVAQHRSLGEHFYLHLNPIELIAEAIGAALLVVLWRSKNPASKTREAAR